jgi:hypothetical protein
MPTGIYPRTPKHKASLRINAAKGNSKKGEKGFLRILASPRRKAKVSLASPISRPTK